MPTASFSAKSNCKYNARSISLPSRSHPTTRRIDIELNRLKSLEAKCQTPSSGSVWAGLSGLEELYISLDDLLNMPSTQQALSCSQGRSCADGLLEGSVRLLDVCGSAREMLISQLVHKGAVACEDVKQEDANEFECVNASPFALCKHGENDGVDSEKLQRTQHQLGALEMSIGGIENALEGLYRRLIRTRASLLNIFSQ